MNSTYAFLLGLGITAGLGLGVVWYLKSHLRGILVDLCGTEARADFWMAFSNVTLTLVPMVFAMQFRSDTSANHSVIFQLADQLEWAFIGLVASVMGLGVVLSRFIRQESAKSAGQSAGGEQWRPEST